MKWFVLFAASLFFIGSIAFNLIVFTLIFTVANYFFGIALQNTEKINLRRTLFWSFITFDVGILAYYKYINFLIENVNFILELFPQQHALSNLSMIIPVGISYYTFQSMGYIIRINRKAEKAERNFIIFANYLTFFPKFLAGPVERSNHFFPQLLNGITFKSENISAGLRLFLWGLFKKVAIGNNLIAPVTMVYNDVHNYTGIPLLVVMVVQTLHLYCDFSGYTDMALGSAKILGINLIDNFNRPFLARNVGEFWRRWHISLSSWCNDFIFSPFIVKYRKWGNRAAFVGIFLTFFVIGIWHGANWTFVVVGLLQGAVISYEFYTKRWRLQLASKLPQGMVTFVSRVLTFLFFCLTLIFFNSHSIHDAWYYITHLFTDIKLQLVGYDFIYEKEKFLIGMVFFMMLFTLEILQEYGRDLTGYFLGKPLYLRWIVYYLMIAIIFYYAGGNETFVYLQF